MIGATPIQLLEHRLIRFEESVSLQLREIKDMLARGSGGAGRMKKTFSSPGSQPPLSNGDGSGGRNSTRFLGDLLGGSRGGEAKFCEADVDAHTASRSEERRGGKECVR